MSYCRFASAEMVEEWVGDPDIDVERSDLYVFLACGGFLECCACRLLSDLRSFTADTTDEMIAHVREHIAAGHAVPTHVIPSLEDDRTENDLFIAVGGDL